MSHSNRRAGLLFVGALALGPIVAATPSPNPSAANGLTFTQRVTSARAAANPNDQSARALSRTTLVRMFGGAVRMDITDGVTPFTGPGG